VGVNFVTVKKIKKKIRCLQKVADLSYRVAGSCYLAQEVLLIISHQIPAVFAKFLWSLTLFSTLQAIAEAYRRGSDEFLRRTR
jgi:hypothetical protein